MSPGARLSRLSLAMERLAHVEQTLCAAAERGLADPVDLPGGALRTAAEDVLESAIPWPDLLEASRELGVPPPPDQVSYRAFLDSVAQYVRPHSGELH